MEKHRCKLCLKNFANGRALGGHMRSHMLNLYVPPKPVGGAAAGEEGGEEEEIESVLPSRSPSSSSDGGEENGNNPFSYGLRENPRKSIKLVDPGFCFPAEAPPGPSSVVLQDRESETESTRNAAVRRRSKRIRRPYVSDHHHDYNWKKPRPYKLSKTSITESDWVDPELPVSSISDTTTEEDLAYCLMMLSRDQWKKKEADDDIVENPAEDDGDGDGDGEDDPSEDYYEYDRETKSKQTLKCIGTRARSKFVCETCNRVFRSYQAFGGHRASHKKMKSLVPPAISPASTHQQSGDRKNNAAETVEEKVHKCPVCYRVFASGQALGGHKRSHVIVSSAININGGVASGTGPAVYGHKQPKNGDSPSGFLNLIDLNLPAPVEDDDDEISQIEVSAVSDGEFGHKVELNFGEKDG